MIRPTVAESARELAWFKSSYSDGPDGDSCVEMATTPGTVHVRDSKRVAGPWLVLGSRAWARFVPYASGVSGTAWFKSSYSSGNDGNSCVEVATAPGTVHVRDSKNVAGPRLVLGSRAWVRFVPYASGPTTPAD